jgi:hypothetical protein
MWEPSARIDTENTKETSYKSPRLRKPRFAPRETAADSSQISEIEKLFDREEWKSKAGNDFDR